jgi:hypothetical protein
MKRKHSVSSESVENKNEYNKPRFKRKLFLEPPFRLMTVARSQSGKTHLLIKLLLWKWVKQFDKIHIFCPTFLQDRKWSAVDQFVKSGKISVHVKFSDKKIKNIWAKCMKAKTEGSNDNTLILFDDCAGQEGFKKNQETGILNQLVCRANHANISTIWSVQKLTQSSTIMRSQAEGLITFQCHQENQVKPLYQEFGTGSLKSFSEVMRECTKHPFHYVYVNRQGPGEPDYYHNFNKIVLDPTS